MSESNHDSQMTTRTRAAGTLNRTCQNSSMNLEQYLNRVGFTGSFEPNLGTLIALHRAHLQTIPYENLEIHFGRTLGLNLERIFERLVLERRGGWCYEMNGLFAWALREIGFHVRLVSTQVTRADGSLMAPGDHVALVIKFDSGLEQNWLVDVGWGNGFLDPLPLKVGKYTQGFLEYRLESNGDAWRFYNQQYGADGFSFTLEPHHLEQHRLEQFQERCTWLQSSPESGFVRVTVCQRFTPEGINTLRGAVLTKIRASGKLEHAISNVEEYEHVLRQDFKLEVPNLHELWAKVWQGHLAWMAHNTNATSA
jgi:N-hydroxyarylamine O-acetyltransferase